MLSLLFWFVAAALAGPLNVEFTAKEVAQLESGGVVVRSPTDDGVVIGAVDIPSESGPVWRAVMNFDARVENVGAIQSIDTYAPATDPKGLGAKYVLTIMGMQIVYHLRYHQDPGERWVTFALDPDFENDLAASTGGYNIIQHGEGQRLVYWSKTDAGRAVPGFIRNALSARSFKSQLGTMRELATGS